MSIVGVATVAGGRQGTSPCGGNGRWLIQNWSGLTSYDTNAVIPVGIYRFNARRGGRGLARISSSRFGVRYNSPPLNLSTHAAVRAPETTES